MFEGNSGHNFSVFCENENILEAEIDPDIEPQSDLKNCTSASAEGPVQRCFVLPFILKLTESK